MIVIVSPTASERAALTAIVDVGIGPATPCDSFHAFKRLLRHKPRIVVTRLRLGDAHSDDVLAELKTAGLQGSTRTIVLIPAGSSSSIEARQVSLGADLVQRDPVRMEVLLEYLRKYRNAAKRVPAQAKSAHSSFRFAGAWVHPIERRLQRGKAFTALTPREVELAEALVQAAGQVVTYETLFHDLLGRRFRNDTSNLRVLLGKLAATARTLGIDVRRYVEVISKMGYRYRAPRSKPDRA